MSPHRVELNKSSQLHVATVTLQWMLSFCNFPISTNILCPRTKLMATPPTAENFAIANVDTTVCRTCLVVRTSAWRVPGSNLTHCAAEYSRRKPLTSGVARSERARVQGFQNGSPSSSDRVRLDHPRRWAHVHCTPCAPYCYATVWNSLPKRVRSGYRQTR